MISLAQMRQCDRCGSVRNDAISNSHFGSGAGPWVSIPYLLQDTSHIYWFCLPKTINQEKTKNQEMRFSFQKIILYCLGLWTQNPGLREKHPKESKSYCTAWTHIWIPALREVDLEPSAKKGTNGTRALLSHYWSSWSLHLKQSPQQISHKSTKVDYQIVSNLKKVWSNPQILCSSAYENNLSQNYQGN